MVRSCLVAAALLLPACASLAPAPRPEIVAYYAGWNAPIAFDPGRVTVVVYSFLVLGADGSLTLDDANRDAGDLERLVALKDRHPHLRVMVAVGGWTRSDRFSDMAANPAMRATFIASTRELLRRYRLDGLDIDWEYPGAIGVPCAPQRTCDRPGDKSNFVTLVRELRTALGPGALITIAAGADRKFLFERGSAAWMRELADTLDWINLMTYDYHGNWESIAGLHAPLHRDPADPVDANADGTVRMYLAEGIAPAKLTLGIPFHAKGWSGCEPGPAGDGLYQRCRAALPEFPHEPAGSVRYWNAASRAPYSYDLATGTFLTFDDERSVREKARYVMEMGLRGAMFWELSADRGGRLGEVLGNALRPAGIQRLSPK
jgi:chitinase